MKFDPIDSDLRAHFQRQRRTDHEAAPAWRLPILRPHASHPSLTWLRLLAVSAAVVVLILSGVCLMKPKQVHQPRLTEALPVLLNHQTEEPLFAYLEGDQQVVDSDFLLPSRFTIHLP